MALLPVCVLTLGERSMRVAPQPSASWLLTHHHTHQTRDEIMTQHNDADACVARPRTYLQSSCLCGVGCRW